MGVDARLYLNTRWELDDIKRVLERTQNTKVEVKSCDDISVGMFMFFIKERMIYVHTNSMTPIGSATLLSLGSNQEAIQIFRDVADVLGGILQEEDSKGNYEFIDGAMDEENGLPYFVKYAIVEDGIDPEDMKAFAESRQQWHQKIKNSTISLIE